jgi:hypothetical protein
VGQSEADHAAQATLVAQRFGVSIEDIARDREIVSE